MHFNPISKSLLIWLHNSINTLAPWPPRESITRGNSEQHIPLPWPPRAPCPLQTSLPCMVLRETSTGPSLCSQPGEVKASSLCLRSVSIFAINIIWKINEWFTLPGCPHFTHSVNIHRWWPSALAYLGAVPCESETCSVGADRRQVVSWAESISSRETPSCGDSLATLALCVWASLPTFISSEPGEKATWFSSDP